MLGRHDGEWCNGNTNDSDSFILGSNPSSPATCLHGQAVKTSPSHGENWGSSPHGGVKATAYAVAFLFEDLCWMKLTGARFRLHGRDGREAFFPFGGFGLSCHSDGSNALFLLHVSEERVEAADFAFRSVCSGSAALSVLLMWEEVAETANCGKSTAVSALCVRRMYRN